MHFPRLFRIRARRPRFPEPALALAPEAPDGVDARLAGADARRHAGGALVDVAAPSRHLWLGNLVHMSGRGNSGGRTARFG